jgi:membrane associated rhomboid family serine protease
MTDLDERDAHVILRMLWAFYLGGIAVAVGFFVAYVVTGHWQQLFAALAACFASWCVTDPLDELRTHAAIVARSQP